MSEKTGYIIQEFPSCRQFTTDVGYLGLRKHQVKALIEIDITDACELLQAYRNERSVEISFTAWILKCISQAICEHRAIHAVREGKNKVIIFDDIDISILVEKEIGGEKVPLPMVIRKTNEKSIEELHSEIKSAKGQLVTDEKNYVLGNTQNKWKFKFFFGIAAIFTFDHLAIYLEESIQDAENDGDRRGHFRWHDGKYKGLDDSDKHSSYLFCARFNCSETRR